jgi:predicted DNA-binding transcriptional regulator AlpA
MASSQGIQDTAEYLPESALCEEYPFSPRTVQRWRATGEGPPYIRVGRRILYRRSDVEAWLSSQTFCHRADELKRASTRCETAA